MTEEDTFNALRKSSFQVIRHALRKELRISPMTFKFVLPINDRVVGICKDHNWVVDNFIEIIKVLDIKTIQDQR